MRALRAHKVPTCNKLEDFYKLWYAITQRAIVRLKWNLECFLIETRSNAQIILRWSDARCLCSTRLKFSLEKRVIFNNFRCSVRFLDSHEMLVNTEMNITQCSQSKTAFQTVTSEGARYHNLWFCDWYLGPCQGPDPLYVTPIQKNVEKSLTFLKNRKFSKTWQDPIYRQNSVDYIYIYYIYIYI